jgi:very-short-patch-repair endonuclease
MSYQQPPPSPIEIAFWDAAKGRIPELEREVKIDRYRVDFLIRKQRVVIELYGFAYHNTKKKLTADAQRERFLQLQGCHVIRFTGSEVYKDAAKCVQEVLDFLHTLSGQSEVYNLHPSNANPTRRAMQFEPKIRVKPARTKRKTGWLGLQVWQVWVLAVMFLLVVSIIIALIVTILRTLPPSVNIWLIRDIFTSKMTEVFYLAIQDAGNYSFIAL